VWIESHQSLRVHPKTRKLARLLGISRVTAVGHLHCVWWWALDYAQDGDLSRWEPLDIAIGADWEDDPDTFIAAMRECRFIDPDMRLHDWHEYAGRLIEQRALEAARKRRNRGLYNDDELVHAVRARDGDACRYCGKSVNWKDRRGADGGTYDHIDPDAAVENSVDNVVVACRACNSAKGRRTPEQAQMHLLPVGRSTANNSRKPTVNLPEPTPNLTVQNLTVQNPPPPPPSANGQSNVIDLPTVSVKPIGRNGTVACRFAEEVGEDAFDRFAETWREINVQLDSAWLRSTIAAAEAQGSGLSPPGVKAAMERAAAVVADALGRPNAIKNPRAYARNELLDTMRSQGSKAAP